MRAVYCSNSGRVPARTVSILYSVIGLSWTVRRVFGYINLRKYYVGQGHAESALTSIDNSSASTTGHRTLGEARQNTGF